MRKLLLKVLAAGMLISISVTSLGTGQYTVKVEETQEITEYEAEDVEEIEPEEENTLNATTIHYAEIFAETYAEEIDEAFQVDSIVSEESNKTVKFEYDKNGKRTKERSKGIIINYEYDEENRLISSNTNGEVLRFTYDSGEITNDCTAIQYQNQTYFLVYDEAGNVSAIKEKSGKLVSKYTYGTDGICKVYGKNRKGKWTDMSKNSDFIGNINPIRKNGNYYDAVSGYYMVNGLCYDQKKEEYVMNESAEEGVSAYTCAMTSANIDTIANGFLKSSTFGKTISYSKTWYSSLSTIELLARIIYGECAVVDDQPAVTWELVNRKAANWSGFYGSGKTNTLWNVATKSYAYSTITGGKGDTDNARRPDVSTDKWKQATWYACALYHAQTRSELSDLVYQPTGINKQCYHVGLCLYDKFTGTKASTLAYNGNKIKNVAVVNCKETISSYVKIKELWKERSGTYNIFFTLTAEYGTYYSIS